MAMTELMETSQSLACDPTFTWRSELTSGTTEGAGGSGADASVRYPVSAGPTSDRSAAPSGWKSAFRRRSFRTRSLPAEAVEVDFLGQMLSGTFLPPEPGLNEAPGVRTRIFNLLRNELKWQPGTESHLAVRCRVIT
jgi:hypothetical protein